MIELNKPARIAAAAATALALTFGGTLSGPTAALGAGALAAGTIIAPAAVPTAPIALSKVINFRDALGTAGATTTASVDSEVAVAGLVVKDGVLWRSGKLAKASAADRATLTRLLAGGIVIDLRTKSVAKSSPDPKLVDVKRIAIPLSAGSYSKFVSSSKRRAAIAKAITTVAKTPGPVLIHCTYGRDRTGWTVAMIYSALGFPEDVVRAEYLRSSGATNAKLNSGLKRIRSQYGSVQAYLETGLKLSPATIAALKAKLLA